jgi:hypothetical protein
MPPIVEDFFGNGNLKFSATWKFKKIRQVIITLKGFQIIVGIVTYLQQMMKLDFSHALCTTASLYICIWVVLASKEYFNFF